MPILFIRPVEKLLSLILAILVRALFIKADLGLYLDLIKSPLPVTYINRQWITDKEEFNLKSFIKDMVNLFIRKN